jgi:hypothetical protein
MQPRLFTLSLPVGPDLFPQSIRLVYDFRGGFPERTSPHLRPPLGIVASCRHSCRMSLAHASESVCGRPSISPRTHSELMRCGEDAIEVSTVKRRRTTYDPPETTFGGSRGHGRPYADDVTNQAWASASWPNTTDTLRHGMASETGTSQSSRPAMSFGLAPELSLGLRHQYTASQTAEWNETTLEKTQQCSPPISQGFSQPRSKPSDPVCDFDTQTLELSCGLGLGQSSQNIPQTTEVCFGAASHFACEEVELC